MLSIKNIKNIKNAGVYQDYTRSEDTPESRRYNLVYGFNGSGKTTLSRIFASCAQGVLDPELPDETQFEFELSDDSSITHNELDALKEHMLVFNVDFVDANLRWREGLANPVFYLGKEQAELAKELAAVDGELVSLRADVTQAKQTAESKKREFETHNRDSARLIAEQLNLGRRYDAASLKADYAKSKYPSELKLDEEAIAPLRSVILQDAPIEKCQLLAYEPSVLSNTLVDIEKLLNSSLGELTLETIKEHPDMLSWVRSGFHYHKQNGIQECLFCGNEISTERFDALGSVIDESLERTIKGIDQKIEAVTEIQRNLDVLRLSIPSPNDIARELQQKGTTSINSLKQTIEKGLTYISVMLELLGEKALRPNMKINSDSLLTISAANEWDAILLRQVEELGDVINEHNKSHDQFSLVQEDARNKLKSHYLASGEDEYRKLEEAVGEAQADFTKAEAGKSKKEGEAEELRQKMRQHVPAADMINDLVHKYLGRKDLEIIPRDEGYEICRNGKLLTGSLSEGEKTAIALCYFISTLEAEGRKKRDLIVVLDDPISSLDTKALNYAFTMIKSALSDVGQLFVLTHNMHFMNEVKKWLRNKAKAENPTASMYFLETTQQDGEESRATSITAMPKLIRDYESEYHYLFHMTLQLAKSPDEYAGFFYLMPNAMRKVLEIFLAFKLPGPDGLTSKVDTIVKGDYDIDPLRISAIDRLVQVESHADNLADLLSFSSMTIEETKDAAVALLEFIDKVDSEHSKRMCKICA